METKVGMPANQNKDHSSGKIDLASLMAVQALGSEKMNIPSRNFFTQTTSKIEVKAEIKRQMRHIQDKVLNGAKTFKQDLGGLGEYLEQEMKKTINEQDFTPLEPRYAAQKQRKLGHTKILIGDGEMRDSITHEEVSKVRGS